MEIVSEKKKKSSHFRYSERLALENYLLGKNKFPKVTSTKELAEIFGKSERTMRREIKRGQVAHTKSDLSERIEYNAWRAQLDAEEKMGLKGRPEKLGRDFALEAKIREMITEKKYSPYAIVAEFNEKGWPSATRICEKTVYNYVSSGLIFGVTVEDLANKGAKVKKKARERRFSRAGCAERSISKRPEAANERSEDGHWEIDTVRGRAGGSTQCLLTLTERRSRYEIIRKMPDAKASSVVAELDKIEAALTPQRFRDVFKSITADGGCEFMDFGGIENSKADGQKRTALYFAHPYRACERGTNENHNRIIRRFFPKGTDFCNVDAAAVAEVQEWMNSYPRKIHGGKTPSACCALLKNFTVS